MQFTIANMLKTTAAVAVLLAIGRVISFELFAAMCLLLFLIAPIVSFVTACVWPTQSIKVRIGVVGFISFAVFCVVLVFAILVANWLGFIATIVGTLIYWLVLWLLVWLVHGVWKAGQQSADV